MGVQEEAELRQAQVVLAALALLHKEIQGERVSQGHHLSLAVAAGLLPLVQMVL